MMLILSLNWTKALKPAILSLMLIIAVILSSASSIWAEGSSTTSTVTTSGIATLEYSECSVAITSGEADFGVWTWDGHRYYAGSDAVSDRIHLSLTGGGPAGCNLTIQSDGFWLQDQPKVGAPAIGPEYLAVWMLLPGASAWSWVYPDESGAVTIPGLKPEYDDYLSVGVGLMGVPATLMPGKYETTFNLTVVDSERVQ